MPPVRGLARNGTRFAFLPADMALSRTSSSSALSKSFGDAVAVAGIDLEGRGQARYCCLLGPSGCGKTSTLRMIAGHESAHRAATSCSAAATSRTCRRPQRGTAMMFQSYALFPHLTVLDNVAFSAAR